MHSTLWLRSNISNKHSSCSSIPFYMLISILWIRERHATSQRRWPELLFWRQKLKSCPRKWTLFLNFHVVVHCCFDSSTPQFHNVLSFTCSTTKESKCEEVPSRGMRLASGRMEFVMARAYWRVLDCIKCWKKNPTKAPVGSSSVYMCLYVSTNWVKLSHSRCPNAVIAYF